MKKLVFGLLIGLLALAGGWLRIHEAGWGGGLPHHDGSGQISARAAASDMEVRRILKLPSSDHSSGGNTPPETSAAFQATGYPLFLFVCKRLFGSGGNGPAAAVRLLQCLLDVLTALLLMATVHFLLKRPSATLLVGALYLLHPAVIRSSSELDSGTLYSFINALLLFCSLAFFRSGGFTRSMPLACGLAFGAGSLFHPAVFPYLLLFIGLAGLQCFFTRKKVQPYLLMLLGCICVLSPWWLLRHELAGPPAQEVHSGSGTNTGYRHMPSSAIEDWTWAHRGGPDRKRREPGEIPA